MKSSNCSLVSAQSSHKIFHILMKKPKSNVKLLDFQDFQSNLVNSQHILHMIVSECNCFVFNSS